MEIFALFNINKLEMGLWIERIILWDAINWRWEKQRRGALNCIASGIAIVKWIRWIHPLRFHWHSNWCEIVISESARCFGIYTINASERACALAGNVNQRRLIQLVAIFEFFNENADFLSVFRCQHIHLSSQIILPPVNTGWTFLVVFFPLANREQIIFVCRL